MADAVAAEIEGALGAVLAQVCVRGLEGCLFCARVLDLEMRVCWSAA